MPEEETGFTFVDRRRTAPEAAAPEPAAPELRNETEAHAEAQNEANIPEDEFSELDMASELDRADGPQAPADPLTI